MSHPKPDLADPSTWPFDDYDYWLENHREPEVDMEDPLPTVDDAVRLAAEVAQKAKEVYSERLGRVWLHGSRARGDHLPQSDLDLVLERDRLEEGFSHIDDELLRYQQELLLDRMVWVQTWFIEHGRWDRLDDYQLKGVRPYAIRVL